MRGLAILLTTCLLAATTSAPFAQAPPSARAELIDARGATIGEATLVETPYNGVWIEVEANGLPPGTHGFHIHETGRCERPTFESAGGHYAPRRRAHGILNTDGAHAGDLLNLHGAENGRLVAERLATEVTLRAGAPNTLFDADGSALVIHAGADDYRSQPSGESGPRIACGVITR